VRSAARLFVPVAAAALAVGGCGAPPPPPGNPAIAIDLACTTCEDYLRCDTGAANPAIYDPSFDLYHLQPRGAAAGMLGALGGAARRPVTIHQQRPGETQVFARTTQPGQQASLDFGQYRLGVGGSQVDLASGDWLAADGSVRGRCRLLEPAEGRQLAALFTDASDAAYGSN
jgi:hypothetical protein